MWIYIKLYEYTYKCIDIVMGYRVDILTKLYKTEILMDWVGHIGFYISLQ